MEGYTHLGQQLYKIEKRTEKAVLFKKSEWRRGEVYARNLIETELTLWVPKKLIKDEWWVPNWFLEKNPPKTFEMAHNKYGNSRFNKHLRER